MEITILRPLKRRRELRKELEKYKAINEPFSAQEAKETILFMAKNGKIESKYEKGAVFVLNTQELPASTSGTVLKETIEPENSGDSFHRYWCVGDYNTATKELTLFMQEGELNNSLEISEMTIDGANKKGEINFEIGKQDLKSLATKQPHPNLVTNKLEVLGFGPETT